MWGMDAERWQKESRPLTHSNLGHGGQVLPPPLGATGGSSDRDREVRPLKKTSGRGSRDWESSPRGVETVPAGREAAGQDGWEVRHIEDPSHCSTTRAWGPKEKRGSHDPRVHQRKTTPLEA